MGFSQAARFEQHVNNQLSKSLGAIPVLFPILQRLRVMQTTNHHCPGKEEVSHGTTVGILALNRLMAPRPLYKVKAWMAETVLEDTLDVRADQMHDTRIGRTLDDLHPYLGAIWQDIVVQAILEYDIDLRFLHYDITSIYFEGAYTESKKIDYGYSRDHRPDAKQVNLGVNVTSETGIPLGYRVLAGRTADRTTPLENMKALRSLLERPELAERERDFLLVSDRAMLDREVLVAYAEKQIRWLGSLSVGESLTGVMDAVPDQELEDYPLAYRPVNQPKDEAPRYHGVLRSATVRYKEKEVPIQILVVKSRTKVKLDRDRRQTYLDRLIGRLEEIQGMLNTRRYKRRDYAWSQIEKARHGNPAKALVDVELTGNDGDLKLTFQLNEEKLAQAEARDGRYLLGTNDFDLSADEMLTRFKKQEVVERRIKVVKGPIRVRPVFLHKEERVESLVFVAMLALLVYAILEMLCRRAGRWITARQVLEKFELLGAVYLQFSDGSVLKLPSELNASQRQLIELLRFPDPAVYLRPLEVES
ncbi:MAG: IS1634 family transposase [Anaerolineae bacterium]|jgi:transposase